MIEHLDPDITWGKKTIALTFMRWDWSRTIPVVVGGNCRALDNLDCAVGILAESIMDADGLLILERTKDGQIDTLEIDLLEDNADPERELMKMLVRAEIISVLEEKPQRRAVG